METTTLARLFKEIDVPCEDTRTIRGISDDSRHIKKDWIFIARRGLLDNGERYAKDALDQGAVVLWEQEKAQNCYHCDALHKHIPALLKAFYGDLCKHLCVIGITGTNGKTSVSLLCEQMFQKLQKRTMVIGTGHVRYDAIEEPIENTTPSICTLAHWFAKAQEWRIPVLIMEVSSHAIDQERIGFIQFDYVIYTNIKSDHLDYHITRTHYQYTKFKLRSYLKQNGVLILNHDDTSLHPLYDFHDAKIITVGRHQAHLQITNLHSDISGTDFQLEQVPFHTKLIGEHTVTNIAECLVILHHRGVPSLIQQGLVSSLQGIKGRNELHEFHHIYVCIDYAHTASSLQTLLEIYAPLKQNRMIVICGCGGDRDRKKRPQMAQIACAYGDITILTTDNPRFEKPSDILLDMIPACDREVQVFENRAYAIKYAVKIAREHDIIVIAGKGEEPYQLINGHSYPFSDYACVKQCLEDLNYDT